MTAGVVIQMDESELIALGQRLGLEEAEIGKAAARALSRTSVALRSHLQRDFVATLSLRSTKLARRRVRVKRFGEDEIEVWLGQNDIPASEFKSPPAGALSSQFNIGSKPFRRVGLTRLPIMTPMVPIQGETDAMFAERTEKQALDLFLINFEREIRARGIFGVGK